MSSLAAMSEREDTHASTFGRYSSYYDLLYEDKDYSAEAKYVARTIRDSIPLARTVLELGSGTGRHGRLLEQMGFDVHGIEKSAEMVAVAQRFDEPQRATGSFTCEVGDIHATHLGRTFDAVIALFHVMSYQATNRDLQSAFAIAAEHLKPGGLFLFDVWHGPAVLVQQPKLRVKEVADERRRVRRTAVPMLDANRSTVKVVFEIEGENLATRDVVRFSEEHVMRYLFATEIDFLAEGAGLRCMASEEFLTGREPSFATWGVAYLLRK
jgi:SAM-dependent methyltransferase